MLKKLLIIVGIFLGLFITAAIAIPLFVDVDKYRPQIVQIANQNINGKLELGKLSLSLWGQLRVEVAGLALTDSTGRKVVSVKDAYFHIPFTSILSGSPSLTFKMIKPEVLVVSEKSGKINLMSLAKGSIISATPSQNQVAQSVTSQTNTGAPTTASGTSTQTSKSNPTSKHSGAALALPAMALTTRLGVELRNAHITYRDMKSGMDTQIKDFNFLLKDISISRPTEIEIWANIEGSQGKIFNINGPLKIAGEVKPVLSGMELDHVEIQAKADFDQLSILIPGTFEKKSGVPAHLDLALMASPFEAKIGRFALKFFNAEINVDGTVKNLSSGEGSGGPVVNLSVRSNKIDLKPWSELIPPLKEFELGGIAALEGGATGPSEKLGYHAKFTMDNLTAKAPMIKRQPKINLLVKVATDQIETFLMTLTAPGNDLKIQGKLVSFSKPKAEFLVTSSGMDLDQLIDFPKSARKGTVQAAAVSPQETSDQADENGGGVPNSKKGSTDAKGVASKEGDLDSSLDSLRKNAMLRSSAFMLTTDIRSLKAMGVNVTEIQTKAYLKGLQAGVESFGMKVFSGAIKASFSTNLEPHAPTYKLSAQAEGVDLREAVESQLQLFKNTLLGKAQVAMNVEGSSLNMDAAISNLKGSGRLRVDHATFATIDVGKMAAESIGPALDQISQKVPGVRGRKVNIPNKESKYEWISSDFTIAGGKFSAPNFMTKAEPNAGIDLRGSTVVGLKNYSLSAAWEIVDNYDVTRAKGIDTPGSPGRPLLAEKGQPVRFPIHVGGTLFQPSYSYTEVPEFLAKVALNNVTGAVTDQAKAQAQKKVTSTILESAPIKNAPPAVQNTINNLGKKLFGR